MKPFILAVILVSALSACSTTPPSGVQMTPVIFQSGAEVPLQGNESMKLPLALQMKDTKVNCIAQSTLTANKTTGRVRIAIEDLVCADKKLRLEGQAELIDGDGIAGIRGRVVTHADSSYMQLLPGIPATLMFIRGYSAP